MKKTVVILFILAMILLAACAVPDARQTGDAAATESVQPGLAAAQTAIEAAQTADELKTLIAQYQIEVDYEAVYEAAMKLMELDPSDVMGYTGAAEALLALSKESMDEASQILEEGYRNSDAVSIAAWVEENNPGLEITEPLISDTINIEGITTGNLSNAMRYNGEWRGGLLTWQGNWVYLTKPEEGFAIYRMRPDGGQSLRLGDTNGFSLNVIGEWLYYINIDDGNTPWKMRTDGSESVRINSDSCTFLSVSDGWMYYDNGSDGGCLYKVKTDGSERVKLVDVPAFLNCISGEWVYYCKNDGNSGLCRVSVDGGEPQTVTNGGPMRGYSVLGGWVYYADAMDPYGVRKTPAEENKIDDNATYDERFPSSFFFCEAGVMSCNMADGTMYISHFYYEDNGLAHGLEFIKVDVSSAEQEFMIEASPAAICTGPDGWVYFIKFSDNLTWYAMDADENIKKIG